MSWWHRVTNFDARVVPEDNGGARVGRFATPPKVSHRPRLRPRSNLLPLGDEIGQFVMVAQDDRCRCAGRPAGNGGARVGRL